MLMKGTNGFGRRSPLNSQNDGSAGISLPPDR
jgi:hypothetical protein